MIKRIVLLVFVGLTVVPISLAKDYTPQECPVVGNINSHIYHVPGGKSYAKMLRLNHAGGDNRQCFQNDTAAQRAGYRRAKR